MLSRAFSWMMRSRPSYAKRPDSGGVGSFDFICGFFSAFEEHNSRGGEPPERERQAHGPGIHRERRPATEKHQPRKQVKRANQDQPAPDHAHRREHADRK